jgi:hypothetical protein
MRKATAQTKTVSTRGAARSSDNLVERQNSLGSHMCVQRNVDTTADAIAPSLVREVLNSPGEPLDSGTRKRMEPQFGYDFSGVRVHTDGLAAASASSLNANAYTAGSHVAFGRAKYAPHTPTGQSLIAHELAHVVQQASGPVSGAPIGDGLRVSHPSDSLERHARANAASVPEQASTANTGAAITPLPVLADRSTTYVQRSDTDSPVGTTAGVFSAFAGIGSLIIASKALTEAKEQNRIGREGLKLSERQAVAGERQADAAEFQATGGFTFDSFSSIGPFYHEHKKLSDDKAADREENAEESEPIRLIHVVAGENNEAVITLTLKSNGKDILGGIIEQGDTRGYVGGPRAASGSLIVTGVNQAATIFGSVATAVIHFRGTNRSGGPIQRFHGKVVVGANGVVYHVECSHTPGVGVADCESRRQPPIIVGMRQVLKENPSSGELPSATPAPRKQPGDDVSSGDKRRRRGEDAGDAGPEPPARSGSTKRA